MKTNKFTTRQIGIVLVIAIALFSLGYRVGQEAYHLLH